MDNGRLSYGVDAEERDLEAITHAFWYKSLKMPQFDVNTQM
jgi:hypothetical protein